MSEQVCYLCSQTKPVLRLFAKCQHESACHDCLRKRYVVEAHSTSSAVCFYPLECFHPECSRRLTTNQIKPLTKKDEEIATFYRLSTAAKVYRHQLGANWKQLFHIVEALGGVEMRKCPGCGMMITKEGGCNHMNCTMCQREFDWEAKHVRMLQDKLLILDGYGPPVPKMQRSQLSTKMNGGAALSRWFDYHDDDYSDDFAPDDEDVYIECEIDSPALDAKANHYLSFKTAPDSIVPPPQAQSTAVCNDNFSAIATTTVASHLISVHSCVDENFSVGSFEILSCKNDDDFEILDCDESSQQQQTEEKCSFQRPSASSSSSWEEVSDVVTEHIDSRRSTSTFADIAKANEGAWKTTLAKRTKDVPIMRLKIVEQQHLTSSECGLERYRHDDFDDEHTKFDCYFDYDGAKCARGGKGKYMFKRGHARNYQTGWDRPSANYWKKKQRYVVAKYPKLCL